MKLVYKYGDFFPILLPKPNPFPWSNPYVVKLLHDPHVVFLSNPNHFSMILAMLTSSSL